MNVDKKASTHDKIAYYPKLVEAGANDCSNIWDQKDLFRNHERKFT